MLCQPCHTAGFPSAARPVLHLLMLSLRPTHILASVVHHHAPAIPIHQPEHLQPTRRLCNKSLWRTRSHTLPWPGMRLLCFTAEAADSWKSGMAHLPPSSPAHHSVFYLQLLSTTFLMTTHAGVWTPPALLSLSIVSNIHLRSQQTV